VTYTPLDIETLETPLNETVMDHLQQGIIDAHAGLPPEIAGQNGKWLKVEGGAMVWSDLPAGALPGDIAYVENGVSVTVNATAQATPNDVVSAGAKTYDGSTRVRIEYFCTAAFPAAVAGGRIRVHLWDASTDLGLWAQILVPSSGNMMTPILLYRYLTPSAGSHTYRVRAWRDSGNGTLVADTNFPMFIRISKVGAAT
jgi:hypothetical protein